MIKTLRKRNPKIEGVRFADWDGYQDVPEYVLCEDRKTRREIWVNIEQFENGEREFGYAQSSPDSEKVKLSEEQEARVTAYLWEYNNFWNDYCEIKKHLYIVGCEMAKLEAKCPTFYAQFAKHIDEKIDEIKLG